METRGEIMSNYKIVFVDIDDTLNPSNEKVSDYTIEVMTKLKEKGIKVVVNTGRSAKYAIEKSIEANLSEYVISSNGAEVYNYYERKEIFSKHIPNHLIKCMYDYCKSVNTTLILNSLEKRFINIKDYKYNNEPAIYFEDIDEVLANNKINQLVVLSSNFDRMLALPNLFKEKFPMLKVIHSSRGLIEDHREKNKEYYHDFVLENTAKSTGIIELLEYLEIDSEDAIAIGNGYEDICMIDVVGTSIAVDNANSTLKELSTYITDSAENDGVAKILEKLCLNEE
jgi:Cof subfamily protein (haloacid dehalogenase superfamily)